MADRRAAAADRCVPRERHSAEGFSYEIAADGSAGSVRLRPGKRALRISADERDYHRVWVFAAGTGDLVGTLECTNEGRVIWRICRPPA